MKNLYFVVIYHYNMNQYSRYMVRATSENAAKDMFAEWLEGSRDSIHSVRLIDTDSDFVELD